MQSETENESEFLTLIEIFITDWLPYSNTYCREEKLFLFTVITTTWKWIRSRKLIPIQKLQTKIKYEPELFGAHWMVWLRSTSICSYLQWKRQKCFLITVSTTIRKWIRSKMFNQGQKNPSERKRLIWSSRLRLNHMPQLDFRTVKLTSVNDLILGCCAGMRTAVPTYKKACTEYRGGRTVDVNKRKFSCLL